MKLNVKELDVNDVKAQLNQEISNLNKNLIDIFT